MRRSALCILACLACFSFLVDEGEAQKVVGRHPGICHAGGIVR